MATLLNYGFTTTTKSPKKTLEPVMPVQKSQTPSATVRSAAYATPIPMTAPLSIPQLEAAAKRESRPVSSVNTGYALVPSRTISKRSRLPPPSAICSNDKISMPLPIVAGPLSPLRPSYGSMPRRPSKGLHDSNRRIQQILKTKQIGSLNVNLDSLSAARHNPRGSIAVTPPSAYGIRHFSKPSLSVQANVAPSEKDTARAPIERDLGALEVIASMPESSHPSRRKKSVVRASLRKSMYNPGSRNSTLAVEVPGGSLMTVVTPEQSAWQRAPYMPGPIRLESQTKTGCLPLATIQETVNAELGLDKERCAAEQAIVDELVSFIERFGKEFKVENTGMDAFWVDSPPPPPLQVNNDYPSPFSNASTLVQSPPTTYVPRLSSHDLGLPGDSFDLFGDLQKSEFISRDLPVMNLKRASFASSQHSGSLRTTLSTRNSLTTYSPPPVKYPYGDAPSPLHSPDMSDMVTPLTVTIPRNVRQIKGKGPTSGGSKMSFRGLIRSAASIV